MSPGRTSGVIGSSPTPAQIVGHPVHQRVAVPPEFFGVHRPKRTRSSHARQGSRSSATFRRSVSKGCRARRLRLGRAGVDAARPALLRRDERLHQTRRAAPAVGRDRVGALSVGAAVAVATRDRARRVAAGHRPGRQLAPQRVRHPRGHRRLLLAGVAQGQRGRRRDAGRDRRRSSWRCSRGRCSASAVGRRLGLAVALAFAGIVAAGPPVLHLRRARGAGRDRGRVLLCARDDLAPPDRPRREPRGGGPALLAGGARHHAAAGYSRPGPGPTAPAPCTCSAPGSAAAADRSR